MAKVHTFQLDLDFTLLNAISVIDRFGGSWKSIEQREGARSLKQLKSVATVQSVGASTRIEGSKMTNDEVKLLIFDKLSIDKLEERDRQEVLGYFNTLDIISESYQDIDTSESSIQNLHNILLKLSEKDQWHKGTYKQHANSVEATNTDGTKTTIFNTAAPGYETEDAMRDLFEWYNSDNATPPIIKTAVFVYDFLSIHPFQDGNGRLSRLLATLLLLKHGYSWIQYVSFEHEIEERKPEYYRVLMECQSKRPGENITLWVLFFLDCLGHIQNKLDQKLNTKSSEDQMTPREKTIFSYIENHPGSRSGEVAENLKIPLPTVKRIIAGMLDGKFLSKYGSGKGTNYTTESLLQIKNNIAMTFNENDTKKEFLLKNKYSFLNLKKLILKPKFKWIKPDDWSKELLGADMFLKIKCTNLKGTENNQSYYLPALNNPSYYEPVFTINNPINIPESLWEGAPMENEFPIKVVLEVTGLKKFDVVVVYDEASL